MTADSEKSKSIDSLLDASSESLDAATLSKLRQARQRALAPVKKPGATWWLPAGAATAASVVAITTFWIGVMAPQARVHGLEDLEILVAADNTELYEQLDFYDWLESQRPRNKVDAG